MLATNRLVGMKRTFGKLASLRLPVYRSVGNWAGTYRARIITQYSSSGKLLKTPHSFTYNKDLTVA
jgi:hypothetical protein